MNKKDLRVGDIVFHIENPFIGVVLDLNYYDKYVTLHKDNMFKVYWLNKNVEALTFAKNVTHKIEPCKLTRLVLL